MRNINLNSFLNHLLKNKLYTVVTILGFSISLTFIILLSVYLINENSVNSCHKNKDHIYRLRYEDGDEFAPPVGKLLQNSIPEIENFTRVYDSDGIISYTNDIKLISDFLMVDSSFFDIFSFKFIEGTYEKALDSKNSVVLTQEFSRKIFGAQSPLGKQIKLNENIECIVTGVVEDISKNTNFKKVDVILNFQILPDMWEYPNLLSDYSNCSFSLYFLERPQSDLKSKEGVILGLLKENLWLYQEDRVKEAVLELLDDVYYSQISGNGIRQNSKTLIKILIAIVFSILILAIINHINLTVAQASLRLKETAVKKLLGSSRKTLIFQFIKESVFLCILAFILAIIFSFLAQSFFNELLNVQLNIAKEINLKTVLASFFILAVVGSVSGIIPAFVITKSNAIEMIKGAFQIHKGRYSKILIGFQYVVVVALLICTIVISKQTSFMQNRYMGFNRENVLWYDCVVQPGQREGLKNKLMSISGVRNLSFGQGTPITGGNNQSFIYDGKPVSFQEFIVDSAFFNIMGIKVHKTGVAYSSKGFWVNQAAIKELGLDSSSHAFKRYEQDVPLLGVVEDFNYGSLHNKIGPVMIGQLNADRGAWNLLIQVEVDNLQSVIENINNAYSEFTGGTPFEYGFMNKTIDDWYNKEKRTAKIVGFFTFLTIIIAMMGIFAMSIFYLQRKIKEIGVRKVNGAKLLEIMLMLNIDFVKSVAIALIIACPLSYYIMKMWLENFAYQTELSWWVFALSGIITVLIAITTVSWQTWRAANRNPVEALRYE